MQLLSLTTVSFDASTFCSLHVMVNKTFNVKPFLRFSTYPSLGKNVFTVHIIHRFPSLFAPKVSQGSLQCVLPLLSGNQVENLISSFTLFMATLISHALLKKTIPLQFQKVLEEKSLQASKIRPN